MAALRKTPTSTNGGSDVGTTYTQAVDTEIEALWVSSAVWLTSVAGTANAITASSDPGVVGPIAAYARPMCFWLVPVSTNTSTVTINIDGIGTVAVVDKDGTGLASGALIASRLHLIVWDGTQCRVWSSPTPAIQPSPAPDIIWEEQQAQNTAGGTFTQSAWQTRLLNTLVRNTISGASQSSNILTLPAGTYCVEWSAPGVSVTGHKTRWFNVTDTTVTALGTSEYAASGTQGRSFGKAVFTISTTKTFRLEHFCNTTAATQGFGVAGNIATEIYAWVNIFKVA